MEVSECNSVHYGEGEMRSIERKGSCTPGTVRKHKILSAGSLQKHLEYSTVFIFILPASIYCCVCRTKVSTSPNTYYNLMEQ